MSKSLAERVAEFANWFNEFVVGSPWAYLFCIVVVLAVYAVCLIQGYSKWNGSTGLFFNTASSSIELITGVGAVVGVYGVRKSHKDLHEKIDKLSEDKDEPSSDSDS